MEGDWVAVTTRRAEIMLCALCVVRTIRPDTVFIPYHWPDDTQRQPAHSSHARSAQQDPGVQGIGVPHSEGGRSAARVGRGNVGRPDAAPGRSS